MRKITFIAAITGTGVLAATIADKILASDYKEALDKATLSLRNELDTTFNDGVKFGRMLQKHDNRPL